MLLKPLDRVTEPHALDNFRTSVRKFLRDFMKTTPPHVRARSWVAASEELSRALAQQGWLGLTLPKSHGGAGLDYYARFVLSEELLACGAPVAAHWIADRQSAPVIMRYGTEAQKDFYVPKVCRGEAFFCIGMSEPDSGSDLASIRSRAVPNDKGWVLNGSKIWTTVAHHCHYMIALVRTSGETADRQQGLSQMIIDLSLPGITIRPIEDMAGDVHFNEVFFEDVQLAPDALIGQEGKGWEQVNAELSFERSGPERIYSSIALLSLWVDELRVQSEVDQQTRSLVGALVGEMAVLRGMSLAVTQALIDGENPMVQASLVKDYGTEFEQRVIQRITDWLGARPDFAVSGELIRTLAYLEQMGVTFSLRGGTREILRGIIARGLGMR